MAKITSIIHICSLSGLMLLIPAILPAQEKPKEWTLDECIRYAHEQNIQIKKNKISLNESRIDTKLAKAQLFPSLSFSTSHGYTNYPAPGNTGASRNSYTGSYGLNASYTLYNGGKRKNTIKQQELQEQIQQLEINASADDIEIAITTAYLQILYAMESVKINEQTVEVSKAQCERSKELLNAGSISKSDYAQLESQYSQDKYQLVVSQSSLEELILDLKPLLDLEITDELSVYVPNLDDSDILTPLPSKESVYNIALGFIPSIQSSKLSINMAELEKVNAKSGYFPQISLNAGIGTGHITGSDYGFGTQMKNKFNENIGVTLSVPIYSNRENKSAVEKAKLQLEASKLDYLNSQIELLKTIESIYQDARSSQNQYNAASEQLKASQLSYELAEEQFYLGMKNTVELLTEKNNYLSAQQEQLQAKYMAILNLQLLNFYQDKPIKING